MVLSAAIAVQMESEFQFTLLYWRAALSGEVQFLRPVNIFVWSGDSKGIKMHIFT